MKPTLQERLTSEALEDFKKTFLGCDQCQYGNRQGDWIERWIESRILHTIEQTIKEGELSDDEIDAEVATYELATDEQKKFIEMGMLAYRQKVMDKYQTDSQHALRGIIKG